MKIAVLSNINQDSLIRRLQANYDVFAPSGFGGWLTDLLTPNSSLKVFTPNIVFVLLDGSALFSAIDLEKSEDVKTEIDTIFGFLYQSLSQYPNSLFFISSIDFSVRILRSVKSRDSERIAEFLWFRKLTDFSEQNKDVFVFDLKGAVEEIGRREFYSAKLWYLGGIKYSAVGEKLLHKMINRYIRAAEGKRKKALLLDCDNTLWGGVLGEESINGIQLSDTGVGARFKDFQKKIKEIKNTGVILALISKNNEADVLEVLQNHSDMVLKENDLVAKKINWSLKSQNIVELSEDLNIGTDSFVFIDDNPVERESVSTALTNVVVAQFPQDTSELIEFITQVYFDYFLVLDSTLEDHVKSQMYHEHINRSDAMRHAKSYESFLESLDTKIILVTAKETDVTRIVQLVQKTNQFNLTTQRYTESDIRNFIDSDEYDVFIAKVSDRFGDNGKVFLTIAKKIGNCKLELDTVLMSCRVMGRKIEDHIMHYLMNRWSNEGYEELIGYYIPTAKNIPVMDIFEKWGFTLQKNTKEEKIYSISLAHKREEVVFFSKIFYEDNL